MSADALPSTLPEAHTEIQRLHQELEQAQWRIGQLEKQLFGPTSERVPSTHTLSKEQILLSLFPPPAQPPAVTEVAVPGLPTSAQEVKPRQPARTPAARVLETVTERIEPQEKLCPHCGQAKCEIGCEKSERFEYVPGKIIRHEIVRPKLACPCGEGGVSIAPLPPTPIEKGYPGPGLVAQVMLAKYDDHCVPRATDRTMNSVCLRNCMTDEGIKAPRDRLTGAGLKSPLAAVVKSHGRERRRKRPGLMDRVRWVTER